MKQTLGLETKFETYKVTGEFEIIVDHNYGADADGNRGVHREWVEEVDIKSIENKNKRINILKRIPEKTLEKIAEWFTENVDIAESENDAKELYADMKFDELRDEGRI